MTFVKTMSAVALPGAFMAAGYSPQVTAWFGADGTEAERQACAASGKTWVPFDGCLQVEGVTPAGKGE